MENRNYASLKSWNLLLGLSGDWAKNVTVDIIGGVGSATIILPEKVGVLVKVERGIGKTNLELRE
ncbi:MAG: hypothetical protein JJE49_06050 [Peptostreptococcaceae bacterium]|nr:hypothetical protein [Peptostreptococcaceae bacterium]